MSLRKFKRRKRKQQGGGITADPVAWFNQGNREFSRGDPVAAIAAYHKALALRPDYIEAMDNLAVVLDQEGEPGAAVDLLRRSLRLAPENQVAENNLAASLLTLGRYREAREHCRAALALAPDYVDAHNNLGTILMAMGDKAGSEAAFRRAVAVDRRNASSWRHLVLCRRYDNLDDPDMAAIAAVLDAAAKGTVDEMMLRFAAGKICDDCGAWDQAFAFFTRANELRQSFNRYDRDEYRHMVDRIVEIFSPDFFSPSRATGGDGCPRPVFIIGMPRSGSSLVEQVLTTHPAVAGVGENKEINRLISRLASHAGEPYPDCVAVADSAALAREGEKYLAWLKGEAGSESFSLVSDKTLTNHLHVGLLRLLFPRARFIHCDRNPLDIAISLYSLYMPEVVYGGSLEDIAFVRQQERRLMDHWLSLDRVFGGKPAIMRVSYEAMVADLEKESRRMLDFLDLPWDAVCLEFHANRRPVNTASAWQVRQPVYTSSVGRWRRYQAHLVSRAGDRGLFSEMIDNYS